ncbi:MAG TPA: deoxyribose-phosphate aldolase [Candidatus Cloacimonadota bacterium]|nr:deoxyribose-phosphate aldolase [Candidatus Cloacimonadota bacterium]
MRQIAIELFGDTHPCLCGGGHEICLKCNHCRAQEPDRVYNGKDPIASLIDATILKADAVETEIRALCELAAKHETASVCVNSQFLALVHKVLNSHPLACTVINFPLGTNSPHAIYNEAAAVLNDGVDEIDMVQNLSALLSGNTKTAFESIERVAELCLHKTILLKVIIETCYLTNEQIVISCLLAKKAGATFVKTSTGFGPAGAKAEHIELMRKTVGPKLGVKASGGIRTKEQALEMIKAGANRIGASNVLAIVGE